MIYQKSYILMRNNNLRIQFASSIQLIKSQIQYLFFQINLVLQKNKKMFNKRILKEETDFIDHPLDGIRIVNLGIQWEIDLKGPENSPYKNGSFKLTADMHNYPYDGPKFHFVTPIFHPNISQNGEIAPEVIGVGINQWSPKNLMRDILQRIQAILIKPDVNDASNPEALELYKTDIGKYNERASGELKQHQH
ncbi:hypothetical protein pb186bvf_014568 [Paramecium bursaria]